MANNGASQIGEINMKRCLFFALCLLLSPISWALDVEGVEVPETTTVSNTSLQLNGAGVRTKMFFDIYVGALYLPSKAATTAEALEMAGPKQVTMTFLYKEVAQEKLTAAWDEGFQQNQSEQAMAELQERLLQFNSLFVTARKGDVFIFDFLADGSTRVTLNGKQAGDIPGADFQRALLAVWLGDKPADKGLKKAMLGE
jgi:hypothetical protein